MHMCHNNFIKKLTFYSRKQCKFSSNDIKCYKSACQTTDAFLTMSFEQNYVKKTKKNTLLMIVHMHVKLFFVVV